MTAAQYQTDKIDWELAGSIARRINQRGMPEHYDPTSVAEDFDAATIRAVELVSAETGLVPADPVKSQVIGRDRWVDVNIASFQRLMRPLFDRLDAKDFDREAAKLLKEESKVPFSETEAGQMLGDWSKNLDSPLATLSSTISDLASSVSKSTGPKIAGAEVGALLGFMSTRVLGQYDLLISPDERPDEQDWVYYVGPNIAAVEHQYGFPKGEYRLWIAIHECTHRAQFMGVPWLRPYFLSLVEDITSIMDSDASDLFDAIKRARSQSDSDEGGLMMKLATPEQKVVLDRVAGLMSLLEGHADVVMDRAGAGLIPSQPRFARVMSHRRQNATGLARFVQKVTGMDAKLAQYAEGEAFIRAVEEAGGAPLFNQVWVSPETLPTLAEIKDPQLWIDRIGA